MLTLRLADAATVLGALALVYVLLPRLLLPRWFRRDAVGCIVAVTSLQAVLGMLWSFLVRVHPGWEAACWLGLVLGLAAWMREQLPPLVDPPPTSRLLVFVAVAGVVLRLWHPLTAAYLGQSDAYSHLQFLREFVANGHLSHPYYPSGYHAVLALPTWLFHLDPYVMVRYGGAFSGVFLVLVLSRLSGACSSRPGVILIAAALVACNPLSYLLAKTNVGVFPNQWGLVLLPFCILELARVKTSDTAIGGWWWSVAGLVACVPMMMIDFVQVALLVLLVDIIVGDVHPRMPSWKWLRWAALVGVVGIVPFFRMDHYNLLVAATLISGSPEELHGGLPALWYLISDYLSIKRWGLTLLPANLALIGLALTLVGVLVVALRHRLRTLRVVSLWGLMATAQTGLGVLQFSTYQRAGWQLLVVSLVLTALIVAEFSHRLAQFRARAVVGTVLVLMALLAFAVPPTHPRLNSPAEEEWVGFTRALSRFELKRAGQGLPWAWDRPEQQEPWKALATTHRACLIVRSFSNFAGHHGDMVAAMRDARSPLHIMHIQQPEDIHWPITPNLEVIVAVDDGVSATEGTSTLFRRISPGLVTGFLEQSKTRQSNNVPLRAFAEAQAAQRPSHRLEFGALTAWQYPLAP